MDKKELEHLCTLTRLSPSKETLQHYSEQYKNLLAYMDVLSKVCTENIVPLYTPIENSSSPRPDEPKLSKDSKEILEQAPESDELFFIVPRML